MHGYDRHELDVDIAITRGEIPVRGEGRRHPAQRPTKIPYEPSFESRLSVCLYLRLFTLCFCSGLSTARARSKE